MELILDFMPVLATCNFEEDPIKTEGAIMSTIFVFGGAQWHVTPKSINKYGWNSTSFNILCFSYLPATLMMIQSKLKAISHPQHLFRRSRAGNSKVKGRI